MIATWIVRLTPTAARIRRGFGGGVFDVSIAGPFTPRILVGRPVVAKLCDSSAAR